MTPAPSDQNNALLEQALETVEIEEGQLGPKRWAVLINRPGAKLFPRTLWERYATQAEAAAGADAARAYLASNGARSANPAAHIEEQIKHLRHEAERALIGKEVRFHPFLRRAFKEPMKIEQISYDASNNHFVALVRVQYSREERPDLTASERWHGEWTSLAAFDWSDGRDATPPPSAA